MGDSKNHDSKHIGIPHVYEYYHDSWLNCVGLFNISFHYYLNLLH